MTAESANALLKLLEEPPPSLVFLMGAPQGAPILPTIQSRCHRLASPRLTDGEMAHASPSSADRLLLRLAHGDPQRLERLLEEGPAALKEGFFRMLEMEGTPARTREALRLAQEAAQGRERLLFLVQLDLVLCRDLLALEAGARDHLLLPPSLLSPLLGRRGDEELWDHARWLMEVPALLERNLNPLLLAESLLLFWV